MKNSERKLENYKWFPVITGLFVAVLLISNIASTKIINIGPFVFDGGTLLFPLSYIFGDILTEVYGYSGSRKVIWTGFLSAILMAATLAVVAIIPPNESWQWNDAFKALFGLVPRIVLASLIAYWAGEFTNSYILAKMKIYTKGKWLWTRTIGSTLVGELVDSVLFVSIAFIGVLNPGVVLAIIISNYLFKTGVEVIMTPLTYKVVSFLKKEEKEDAFDDKTNFNPFLIAGGSKTK